MNSLDKYLLTFLLLLLTARQCGSKRGGISLGRGSSSSRGGIFKSPSGARTGIFGAGGARATGGGGVQGGGWNRGGQGIAGNRKHAGTGWGSNSRGTQFGRPKSSIFTKSNIGSFVAGAAAGYLTYKAGKALIRSAYTPMMWNNRPYYWGSNYYRGGGYGTHMCRMPVDGNDPQLGNVFFEDGQSRPREIVWSCSHNEYCCGYDCCWRGRASSFYGFGLGTILALLIGLSCVLVICVKLLSSRLPSRVQKYMRGNQMNDRSASQQVGHY